MRNKTLILVAISIAATTIFIACQDSKASEEPKSVAMTQQDKIKRGEYLVNSIGCDDCHSPKRATATGFELIPELRLSGFNPEMAKLKPATDAVNKDGCYLAPILQLQLANGDNLMQAILPPMQLVLAIGKKNNLSKPFVKENSKDWITLVHYYHQCHGLFIKI